MTIHILEMFYQSEVDDSELPAILEEMFFRFYIRNDFFSKVKHNIVLQVSKELIRYFHKITYPINVFKAILLIFNIILIV